MDLISRKEAIKKGIEHLVITEEDFQKYIQQPSDEYERTKLPDWLHKELALLDALPEEED